MIDFIAAYWRDGIEILILALIFYRLANLIQGTRALQMLLGLTMLLIISFVSLKLGLHTIHWIFANFLSVLMLTVVILFQPELRRALANLGRAPVLQRLYTPSRAQVFDELARAAAYLAGKRIGALMVLQRETEAANYVEEGLPLDAKVSKELLTSIFLPNSPIHDGAVIIKDDRILTAGAFLPLSLDPKNSRELGTRHRAAIGISEETDAVVIVVSEETGILSLVVDGQISRNLDSNDLRQQLRSIFSPRGEG